MTADDGLADHLWNKKVFDEYDGKGQIPNELYGRRVVNWTWDAIKKFIGIL